MQRIVRAVVSLCALTAPAFADLDLPAQNGDKVAGTLSPGAEVETFRFRCPAGAVMSAKAKSAKKGPALHVRILDGASVSLGDGAGKSVSLKTAPLAASGEYRVVVSSQDGTSAGDYALSISWKSPASFSKTSDLAGAQSDTLAFAVDAGVTATISAKPAKKSAATAALEQLTEPDAINPVTGTTLKRILVLGGDYVLAFKNAGAAQGRVTATVKIKLPRTAKRKLRLTGAGVPPGASVISATLLGPAGGTADLGPAGPLTGTSVQLPAGAVGGPVTILIGQGSAVVVTDGSATTPGGPAVFIGPEGIAFKKGHPAKVTIPYEPLAFPAGLGELRIFTREADGTVTEVTGLTVDSEHHTVSFAASKFSVFQALRVPASAGFHSKTFRSSPAQDDGLADSMAEDGGVLIVGASKTDLGVLVDAGTVYSYTTATILDQPQILEPSTSFADDRFGASVAISGNVLAVGCPGRNAAGGAQTGSVFVFRRSGGVWMFEAELFPGDGQDDDEFGAAVGLDGNTLVVGSPRHDHFGHDAGVAYAFHFDGSLWSQEEELDGGQTNADDEFGSAVAVSGSTALIGAPVDAPTAANQGAVYVFLRGTSTWSEEARLNGSGQSASAGRAVALDGDTAAIAQPGAAGGSGNVALFARTGAVWSPLQTVTGAGAIDEQFGASIALRGPTLVVGATTSSGPGKAFAYHRASASSPFEIAAVAIYSDVQNVGDARFGASVAIASTTLIAVGSPGDDVPVAGGGTVIGAGSLWEFDIPGIP